MLESFLRAKMPFFLLTYPRLGYFTVDCCCRPDGRHDVDVISWACLNIKRVASNLWGGSPAAQKKTPQLNTKHSLNLFASK